MPYSTGNISLSEKDCASDDQMIKCSKYPYRRAVGQLIYGIVHTLITTTHALKILSRYRNNPGPRHIEFLRSLKYCKFAKLDRLKFYNDDGPLTIEKNVRFTLLRGISLRDICFGCNYSSVYTFNYKCM